MRAFLGYLGTLFILVGQLIYFTLPSISPLFFGAHMALGAVCLVGFFLAGGLKVGGFNRRLLASFVTIILLFTITLTTLLLLNKKELFSYDSTMSKVFSLSEETVSLLDNLPGKLTVRAFYLGAQIDDRRLTRLLRDVASYGVVAEIVDPEQKLLELEKFGVTQSETLHLSLVLPDGTERSAKGVSVASEDGFLAVLKKVLRNNPPQIVFTKGNGEPSVDDKLESGYLFLRETLEGENYEVKAVSEEVPAETKLLIVAAPAEPFAEEFRRSIVQYLSRGGSVLLLNEARRGGEVRGLARLFGIEVGDNLVIDPLPQGGMGVQPRITEFSAASSITRGFNRPVLLTTATSITRTGDERNVKEIAFTSQSSWAETNLALLFSDSPVAALESEDLRGPVPVMAAYDGSVGSPRLSGRAVAIGDSDFVNNLHLREVGNRDLLLNAVSWLLGEEQSQLSRVRTLLQSRERLSVEDRDRIFLLGAVILPELLAIFGLVILYRRGR